jgi:hypothetical protein
MVIAAVSHCAHAECLFDMFVAYFAGSSEGTCHFKGGQRLSTVTATTLRQMGHDSFSGDGSFRTETTPQQRHDRAMVK